MPATHRAHSPRQELGSGTLIRPVRESSPGFPGLTGGRTSWLAALPAALHETGRDEGGSTADTAGPPGRQKAQVRQLLPPTGVGRRRGWPAGGRGSLVHRCPRPPASGTDGRTGMGGGRYACASAFSPQRPHSVTPSRGRSADDPRAALSARHTRVGTQLPGGVTPKAAIAVPGQSLLRAGYPHTNLPEPPPSSGWSQGEPKLATDPGQSGPHKCPAGAAYANKTRWSLIPRVACLRSRVHTLPDLCS